MAGKLPVFRIDRTCFVIYLPTGRTCPFLRLGDSPNLTPFMNNSVGVVVFTQLFPINLQYELDNIKRMAGSRLDFMALPAVMYQFRHDLQNLEHKYIQVKTIPVKTGSFLRIATKSLSRLQAHFFTNKNLKLLDEENVVFDLLEAMREEPEPGEFERNRKKLYHYMELTDGLQQQGVYPKTISALKALDERSKEEMEVEFHNLVSQYHENAPGDCLVLAGGEQQVFDLKYFGLEFEDANWSDRGAWLELDHLFRPGEKIELRVQNDSVVKLKLPGVITAAKLLRSGNLYQYHIVFEAELERFHEKAKAIKLFRLQGTLERFFDARPSASDEN